MDLIRKLPDLNGGVNPGCPLISLKVLMLSSPPAASGPTSKLCWFWATLSCFITIKNNLHNVDLVLISEQTEANLWWQNTSKTLNSSLVCQCDLRISNYTILIYYWCWKFLKTFWKSEKERKMTENKPFFVFAINNFHCCMEAISTTERKNSATRSKNQHVWKKLLKKQHRNNNILQVHTKIYRREDKHPTGRSQLSESDIPAGRLGTSNTAQGQRHTSSSRPNEPKSGQLSKQHCWEKCIKIVSTWFSVLS